MHRHEQTALPSAGVVASRQVFLASDYQVNWFHVAQAGFTLHYLAKNDLELPTPVHSTSQCPQSSDDVFKSCVLFIMHTPGPVACTMCLQVHSEVRVAIDSPELELQVAVNHQVGRWESNLGQLREQPVL